MLGLGQEALSACSRVSGGLDDAKGVRSKEVVDVLDIICIAKLTSIGSSVGSLVGRAEGKAVGFLEGAFHLIDARCETRFVSTPMKSL